MNIPEGTSMVDEIWEIVQKYHKIVKEKKTMRTKEEINKNKPKFSKKKCAKCKWRGYGHGGYLTKVGEDKNGKPIHMHVYCNYTSLNNKSCIQRVNKNNPYNVYDIRGDEYNNCLLFEKGAYREDVKKNISIVKGEEKHGN